MSKHSNDSSSGALAVMVALALVGVVVVTVCGGFGYLVFSRQMQSMQMAEESRRQALMAESRARAEQHRAEAQARVSETRVSDENTSIERLGLGALPSVGQTVTIRRGSRRETAEVIAVNDDGSYTLRPIGSRADSSPASGDDTSSSDDTASADDTASPFDAASDSGSSSP